MVYELVPEDPPNSGTNKPTVILDFNDADPNASTVFGLPTIEEPAKTPIPRQITDTVERLARKSGDKPARPQGTGSGYVRNNDRAKRVRKFGAAKDNIAQAQMRAERLWRIAIAGAITITATLGGILVHGLAPTVQRMNANDYKPMDGILAGLKGKPIIATLDDHGKLYFAQLSDYDSKTENGELLVRYKMGEAIDPATAVPEFAKKMIDIELRYTNRPLTPRSTAEDVRILRIINQLRDAVAKWRSENEKPEPPKPIGVIDVSGGNIWQIAQNARSQKII